MFVSFLTLSYCQLTANISSFQRRAKVTDDHVRAFMSADRKIEPTFGQRPAISVAAAVQ